MYKRLLPLLLAAACLTASASNYYVVVPVKGRTATPTNPDNISVVLTPGTLPAAVASRAYRADLKDHLLVTGDSDLNPSLAQWSSGSLPQGMSLSSDGVLAGTPVVAGQYGIQANVAYKGKQANSTFSLFISRLPYQLGFEQGLASSESVGVPNVATLSLSTEVAEAGTTSLLSTATGNADTGSVQYPATAGLQLGTGDFTIEAWGYRTATNGSYSAGMIALTGDVPVELTVDDVVPPSGPVMAYPAFTLGNGRYYGTTAFVVPLNQWVKYSLVRRSGLVRFYVNGVQMPIATYNGSLPNSYTDAAVSELSFPDAVNATGLLVANRVTASRQWKGYIDGIRVSAD